MILSVIVSVALLIETISDIRTKTVSVTRLLVYFLLAVAGNIIFYYQTVSSMIGGIIVGVIVLIYGIITKEGIGYGDGLVFMCLGAAIGLSNSIRVLFLSLMMAIFAGGVFLLVKHKDIKTQIPFVPCILCSFLVLKGIELVI